MKVLKSVTISSRAFLFSLFILLRLSSWCQVIPVPLGEYGIGHHRFEWTDSSQTEVLADDGCFRKLVVDVWYPAEKSLSIPVPYPDTLAIYHAFGNEGLKSFLGKGGEATIRSGNINTHAYEDAAFDHRLQSAPVIFFSHGMGMISQVYTTQIEDLASHGYIVVAIAHPYDAWLISFTNGSFIPFEVKQRNAGSTTEEHQITYENKRIDWWASDISFALDQLIAMKGHEKNIPFTDHLDLKRIGTMGHSAGGRAAARTCQVDERIKSCADQGWRCDDATLLSRH
jgi:predicted dienelactone hydrolase